MNPADLCHQDALWEQLLELSGSQLTGTPWNGDAYVKVTLDADAWNVLAVIAYEGGPGSFST